MRKNLLKAIILMALGIPCVGRGLSGPRHDDHDYKRDGIYAGMTRAINTELIRQANDNASRMMAVGTLALLSAPKPWNEYGREKSGRDELYSTSEDE